VHCRNHIARLASRVKRYFLYAPNHNKWLDWRSGNGVRPINKVRYAEPG